MMKMWNQPTLFAQAVTLSCIIAMEISYVPIHKTSITLRFFNKISPTVRQNMP